MNTVELGGGQVPRFHPNVDCRKVENVDIMADFERPLPLASEGFDAVYSAFAMEHVSWRNVQQFVNEIYRVLKSSGRATVITSNLRAQCLYLLKKEVWGLPEVETIFGSQEYPENSHKSSMSPECAERLFRDAGFNKVKVVTQVGICGTDMLIEAEKLERVELFGRKYFDGEGYVGMYRDFPQHYKTAEIILDRKPTSVLEIGGASGYICKILQAHGVPATCMDISDHCWHTRVINEFILWDATRTPYNTKSYRLIRHNTSKRERIRPLFLHRIPRTCPRGQAGADD